jgi:polysaccharide chain length determinant protein (PEP-CTERM system associated)
MGSPQNEISVTRRPPDIEDYIDIVRRYRSWILGPAFGGLVVAVVVAFLWPDTYVSTATMRITPQQVPERLVPSALSSQMAERLQQMETDILSRGSLSEIIQKPSLDLYKRERQRLPMEDIVQDMKNKHIQITPMTDPTGTGLVGARFASAFQIRFSYIERYKAQAVVRELVTKFTEQNVTVQRNQANMTTSFLNDELKAAKEKMDTLEAQITKFKVENQGHLPEQSQANAQSLQLQQMALMNLESNISRVGEERMMLETQIQNNKDSQLYWNSRVNETLAGATPQAASRNELLTALVNRISAAKQSLAALKNTYGDAYPEIGAQQASIDSMEKEREQMEKDWSAQQVAAALSTSPSSPQSVVNPTVERTLQELQNSAHTYNAQIQAKVAEVAELRKQESEIEKRIAVLERQIQEAPLDEQQYSALLRDLNLAKTDYEDMVKRRNASEMQEQLEEHKAGENLEVLDPASLPELPSEPNRPAWAGAGLLGGVALGVVLAGAREVKNTSLKNLKDVRVYTNLPVLSSIPLLENGLLVRRKRRLVWLTWSSAIIIGAILMSGSMYYHYSSSI